MLNEILDAHEVAEILDCEPNTVREKARRGELPAVKFGRSWRFPKDALLKVLNELALANKPKERPHITVAVAPTEPRSRRKKLLELSSIPTARLGLHPGATRTEAPCPSQSNP